MGIGEFKLEKEEIARQLHYVIREAFPDKPIDGNLINKMLIEDNSDGGRIVFPAGDFAEVNGIVSDDFTGSVCRELGIEFEKNLHDKFFFTMSREGGNIIFRNLE